MVVAALLVIVAGGLLTTFLTGQASYRSAEASIQVQQEARRALDAMVREMREAGSVSATANQLNFKIALGYNLSSPCPANDICWGADGVSGQYVHYALIGTPGSNARQLVRYVDAAGSVPPCTVPNCRVLANYVDDVGVTMFSWDSGNKVVTLNLKITYNDPSIPNKKQTSGVLTSRVRLRNP